MKIKSLLIGMLASTAFVACTNDESPVDNQQGVEGKSENYVAVNIVMPGIDNRAVDDYGFDEGTTEERTVNGAVFLFLDGNNNGCATPYYVEGKDLEWGTVTDKPGQDKKATVLVIENNKKQLPAYIVAVLNPVGGANHGYTQSTSLANLKASVDA